MNILPKKSWHVRTRKNIDRVQRDEAEAERLAKIEQDRILNVEQECRIRELRARSGFVEPTNKHFNLFEGYEDQQQTINKDNEYEKRLNEGKFQNNLGRLVDVNKPWYCSSKQKIIDKQDKKSPISGKLQSSTIEKNGIKDSKRSDLITSIYDPMTAIKEAEEIVKLKRLKQKLELESIRIKDNFDLNKYHNKELRKSIEDTKPIKIEKHFVHSDSSPEIIGIVKSVNNFKKKKEKKKSHKHKKRKKSHKHRRGGHKNDR